MKRLLIFLAIVLCFSITIAYGQFGQGSGGGGSGDMTQAVYDTDADDSVDVAEVALTDTTNDAALQQYVSDHAGGISASDASDTARTAAGDSVAQARTDAQNYIDDSTDNYMQIATFDSDADDSVDVAEEANIANTATTATTADDVDTTGTDIAAALASRKDTSDVEDDDHVADNITITRADDTDTNGTYIAAALADRLSDTWGGNVDGNDYDLTGLENCEADTGDFFRLLVDTLYAVNSSGDTVPAIWVDATGGLHFGGAGLSLVDSLEASAYLRVVVSGDTLWINADSIFSDARIKFCGEIDTTDEAVTTYVSNHAGGTIDGEFIDILTGVWSGGSEYRDPSSHYYQSAATNDYLFFTCNFVAQFDDNAVIVDTLNLKYYTQGNEDSVIIYLQEGNNSAYTSVKNSGYVGGGSTGWATANIITGGDYTVTDDRIFRVMVQCVNDGANDIRVECDLRKVWHQ